MATNFRPLKIVQDQKRKAPTCKGGKQAIARMCTFNKCNETQNSLMCCLEKCSCNMTHSNCYEFINFQCFRRNVEEIQTQSYKDIFESLLAKLNQIIKSSVDKYNQLLTNYETFLMPEPLANVKKGLEEKSAVTKESAVSLKAFYDTYPDYEVPKLINYEEYKLNVQKITKIVTDYLDSSKTFLGNLFHDLVVHEKMTKLYMEQVNIQKKAQKNERSTSKQQPVRNESPNKSPNKK